MIVRDTLGAAATKIGDLGVAVRDTYKRKTAPAGNRGLTSAGTSRQEAVVIMVDEQSDENPEARGELFSVEPRITPPVERHWYVDAIDAHGYCAACGLPRSNRRRHVPRAA